MGTTRLNSLKSSAKWAAPSFALAVVLGLTLGYIAGWLVYWLLNAIGVWLYCDGYGPHDKVRAQRWIKGLSMALLPTGFVGLMSGGGGNGPSPRETSISGTPEVDGHIRNTVGGAGGDVGSW